MEQFPTSSVPDFCEGMLNSVMPVDGRFFLTFKSDITNDELQSKVLFVFIFSIVSLFAFASTTLGEYPPFAVISIICLLFSSTMPKT